MKLIIIGSLFAVMLTAPDYHNNLRWYLKFSFGAGTGTSVPGTMFRIGPDAKTGKIIVESVLDCPYYTQEPACNTSSLI